MKKILAFALLALPILAHADDYHFSDCMAGSPVPVVAVAEGLNTEPEATCVAGNNTTGTGTAANPWRNIKGLLNAGLAVRTLPAGSRLLLARGSVWYQSWPRAVILSNTSTKALPLEIDDYIRPTGSAGDRAPLILTRSDLPVPDCTAICTRMFDFQGVAARRGTEAYSLRDIKIRGYRDINFVAYIDSVTGKRITTGNDPRVAGQFGIYFNGVSGLTVENMDAQGLAFGIEAGGSEKANTTAREIVVRNSIFRFNSQGIHGGFRNSLIENNTFSDNAGNGGVFVHNVYFGFFVDSTFRNNIVENNARDPISGQCDSVSMVMHGSAINSVIERNTFRETNPSSHCFLISVDPAYPTTMPPEEFKRLVFRDNLFVNWGAYGLGLTSCNDCVVERNVFYKNTSPTTSCAICTPGSVSANNTSNGTPSQDLTGSPKVKVLNNSIYIASGGPAVKAVGIRILINAASGGGTGYVIAGNVIVFAGSITGIVNCFNIGTPSPGDFAVINNNLCYGIPGTTVAWSTTMTLAQAQAAPYGFASVHLSSDPLLVAVPTAANNYNMSVQVGSPTRNAGHATEKSRLGYGARVPVDATWIGAWPYGTTLIAPASPGRPRAR